MPSAAAACASNQAARALYEILVKDTAATHFKVLPDPIIYPDYYAVITRPVCLADLWKFITAGRYALNDAQRDLRRMIANAKRYNRPDAPVYSDALSLEVSRPRTSWEGRRGSCGPPRTHTIVKRPPQLTLPPLPSPTHPRPRPAAHHPSCDQRH